eukprot:3861392-Rhodomonas_salina.3
MEADLRRLRPLPGTDAAPAKTRAFVSGRGLAAYSGQGTQGLHRAKLTQHISCIRQTDHIRRFRVTTPTGTVASSPHPLPSLPLPSPPPLPSPSPPPFPHLPARERQTPDRQRQTETARET